MKQSLLFTKTRKEAPKDEVAKNAQLLIRGGFVHKELAGVYSYLPLGLRVLNKIIGIIREEMNAVSGQEVTLSALQDPAIWKNSGRWDDSVVDVWFKTALKNGTDLGLGFTHEEPMSVMMKNYISSYRDLPKSVYQFQTKFRNETRAKSGIMRSREFVMKDLYTFARTQEEHGELYEKLKQAYIKVFERVGLGEKTYVTFASGGTFAKYSHEFQTVTDAGEDIIYVHEGKKIAVNSEVYNDEVLADLGLSKAEMVEKKAAEVGNIFSLGTKFSEPIELTYTDEKGDRKPVIMGSYGIGPGRVMGVIAELMSTEKGIVWPVAVAPFKVHLIPIFDQAGKVAEATQKLYDKLTQLGIDVLCDDRDARAGEKFADADLIGIPWRVVVSEKTLAQGGYECLERITGKITHETDEGLTQKIL